MKREENAHARLWDELGVQQGYEADARKVYDQALKLAGGSAEQATTRDFAALSRAYQHLLVCRQAVHQANAALDAHERRTRDATSRRLRQAALEHTLSDQYQHLGPQYGLLVERLIQAVLAAEAMEKGYEPFDPEEHRAYTYQIKAIVDQLQKHTESVKQEVVNRKVEMQVLRVLEIAEGVVAPQSPILWQSVLKTIEQQMPRLDHREMALPAPPERVEE